MESFVSRYKNALVLIVVLVAQLLALAVQVKRPAADAPDARSVSLIRYAVVSVITPPERLLHNIGLGIRGIWLGYLDLVHVRQQNNDLKTELERLRLEQASVAEDARQGQRLQQLLGFKEHYIYKTLPAQVIGTSGTEQSRILYIDKGSEDGLAPEMPVVTGDGIVGKLKDVFPHTSQVLEISDPTSGVGAILQTTRIRGVLKGSSFGQVQMINVSPDERIKAGETVLTSGGDQIFPRGLPVGTVERVVTDPDRDPLVDVMIHPAANLSRLEEVLVITDLGDETPKQEVKDLAESEAEGLAAQKRASDILSERLPNKVDPNAPSDTNPQNLVDEAGNAIRPLAPPKPLHPDQFSPNATPAAAEMTPGQRTAPVRDGIEEMATKPASASSRPAPAADSAGSGDATAASAASPKPAAVPARTIAPTTASASSPAHKPAEPAATGAGFPARAAVAPQARASSSAAAGDGLKVEPKTRVIVDGPIVPAKKKTTEEAPLSAPARTPSATPARKGPVLVPDDGSRPPSAERPRPAPPSSEPASTPQRRMN